MEKANILKLEIKRQISKVGEHFQKVYMVQKVYFNMTKLTLATPTITCMQ